MHSLIYYSLSFSIFWFLNTSSWICFSSWSSLNLFIDTSSFMINNFNNFYYFNFWSSQFQDDYSYKFISLQLLCYRCRYWTITYWQMMIHFFSETLVLTYYFHEATFLLSQELFPTGYQYYLSYQRINFHFLLCLLHQNLKHLH